MKVLIVDDSAMLRTVVKKAVASMGVQDIVEAGDGVEALKVLESGDVDLIFSDWNMPNMTGLEFLKETRAKYGAVPFIMATTEGSKEKVMEAIANGVTDYMVKPFTQVTIVEKIGKWCPSTV